MNFARALEKAYQHFHLYKEHKIHKAVSIPLNDNSEFEDRSLLLNRLVLLTAVNAIRPAIGNPNAARARKTRFFTKKYYPGVKLILRSIAKRRVEIFLQKPKGQAK